jgi:hypothetical protein
MEALSELVNESLARHGVVAALDYHRLSWSQWFPCESSLSALIPGKPGIFALAQGSLGEAPAVEPLTGENGRNGAQSIARKRILALFNVSETEDLGIALGRLFFPGAPDRERLEAGDCFIRYAVIEDTAQRQSAYLALKRWMDTSAEMASGFGD